MKDITLESERLIYKRVSSEHVTNTYVNWMNDPEVNLYLESGGNYTLKMLRDYIDEQYKNESFFWAIHLKGSNKHIGNIRIHTINLDTKTGDYGIMMGDKDSWGKGYAKEATVRIIKYCFEELKLCQIGLGVIQNNVRAVHLYKDIGFKIDEVKQDVGVYNNKVSNSLRMLLHVKNFK